MDILLFFGLFMIVTQVIVIAIMICEIRHHKKYIEHLDECLTRYRKYVFSPPQERAEDIKKVDKKRRKFLDLFRK